MATAILGGIGSIAGSLGGEDIENLPLLAGISAAGISDIKSCQEVIQEIIKYLKV